MCLVFFRYGNKQLTRISQGDKRKHYVVSASWKSAGGGGGRAGGGHIFKEGSCSVDTV